MNILWKKTAVGRSLSSASNGGHFSFRKINPLRPLPTLLSSEGRFLHWELPYFISDEALVKCSSFPNDYKFQYHPPNYILGMSVPPLMIHGLTEQIVHQLF